MVFIFQVNLSNVVKSKSCAVTGNFNTEVKTTALRDVVPCSLVKIG
jgi:hypothetical protein